jgi:hypothetical protein
VVLVGGSFRIPAILEKIKHRLLKGGAIDSNLLFPSNPESLSVQGMVELFLERNIPQLKVVKDDNSDQQENQLQRTSEISKPDSDSGSTTGDGALLLDSQSA